MPSCVTEALDISGRNLKQAAPDNALTTSGATMPVTGACSLGAEQSECAILGHGKPHGRNPLLGHR